MKQSEEQNMTEPNTETLNAPPTDAQWYSPLAAMANGDEWPSGPESLGDARRYIRAALDKVNALEIQLANAKSDLRAELTWRDDALSAFCESIDDVERRFGDEYLGRLAALYELRDILGSTDPEKPAVQP